MKKLATLAALAILGAVTAIAQGNIQMINTSAFPLRVGNAVVTQVVGTASTILGASSVRVTLLVGANGAALSSMVPVTATTGFQIVTNTSATTAFAQGQFSGGAPAHLPNSAGVFDGSAPIQFMYIAWDIASGLTSFDQVYNLNTASIIGGNYVAVSPIIQGYTPSTGANAAAATFGSNPATQLPQLLLLQVPEPGTFVLAGLGAAGLLIFRRRK